MCGKLFRVLGKVTVGFFASYSMSRVRPQGFGHQEDVQSKSEVLNDVNEGEEEVAGEEVLC